MRHASGTTFCVLQRPGEALYQIRGPWDVWELTLRPLHIPESGEVSFNVGSIRYYINAVPVRHRSRYQIDREPGRKS